jgi:hypothetical protein
MEQNWITTFDLGDCTFCFQRFECQLETLTNRHPDHAAVIMFTSALQNCVELRFVDPEDDVSEWTWWVWIRLSSSERKELGSTI